MRSIFLLAPLALAALALAACGGAASAPSAQAPGNPRPNQVIRTERVIVTPTYTTTEPELSHKAEVALLTHQYKEAADDYEVLVASDPNGPNVEGYLLNLATAYEGLEQRAKARDRYREIAQRFPSTRDARTALVRAATLEAYLENWKGCGEIADLIFARTDVDDVDRIVAYGARTLSLIEVPEPDLIKADHTIIQGVDLAEQIHFGGGGTLPVALAQLRFALGEVRRVKEEQIHLDNVPLNDFIDRFNQRAQGAFDAQYAYAEAVHSEDPHWAVMASERVGEMYAKVHHDLMTVPPPAEFKTERDKQVFYAFMHIRFRAILQKGLAQMNDTIALADRIHDESGWVAQAKHAKADMEQALDDEQAELQKMPFTEAEVEREIAQMAKSP
jgi:tetratricopeptide (TPR) repeat protein